MGKKLANRKLSGKFVLRLDPILHARIKKEAIDNQVSLNQLIVTRLADQKKSLHPLKIIKSAFGSDLIGIIAFGSYIRGEERSSSDIDLLMVISEERPIERSLYQIWDIEIAPHIDAKYEPQFSHLPKNAYSVSSFWLELAMEGEIEMDQSDHRIKKMLLEIREQIALGRYQRKLSHGHPYWVRQDGKDAK